MRLLSPKHRRNISKANKKRTGWHLSEEAKQKISLANKGHKPWFGKHHTEETKQKIRETRLGESNWLWKGVNVKSHGLHLWVRSRLPEPDFCEMCNEKPPHDLANVTGTYSRDLVNWKYYCRKCHMISDGRIGNLKQYARRRL